MNFGLRVFASAALVAATIVNAGKMNTGHKSQAVMPPPKQKKVKLIDETNLLICFNNKIDE